jgi:hypothetical protein
MNIECHFIPRIFQYVFIEIRAYDSEICPLHIHQSRVHCEEAVDGAAIVSCA